MRSPQQFAVVVHQMVDAVNFAMLGAQGTDRTLPMLVWPEMADAQWREAAMNALDTRRVMNATFCEPNELNDWIFKAQRRIIS